MYASIKVGEEYIYLCIYIYIILYIYILYIYITNNINEISEKYSKKILKISYHD